MDRQEVLITIYPTKRGIINYKISAIKKIVYNTYYLQMSNTYMKWLLHKQANGQQQDQQSVAQI